ncbi:universal stress protein [Mycobacterium sp. ITM-2016-00316]|uniref:universal stress protein n=1 Tax=Mycobacterium sp. ITM-2016-00316 TaxID=2099695 RepID=UPI000CFA0E5F|nr:universal stress protein [Mycobacterium sp. ITM-2016-00316]WNG83184.1 universal stress protein [Mycobacterium sp. ITM-2016-00316]
MRLAVGYLATPGGADAVALGVRLARSLGAELDVCMVLPPDRGVPAMVPTGGYDELLAAQAGEWLNEALAGVPDDVVAHSHVSVSDSTADGLINEVKRLGARAVVVGGSGGGLAGSYSLGSVVNELLHSAHVPVAVAPKGTRLSAVERVREVTCAIGERAGAGTLLNVAVRACKASDVPLRLVSLVALDPMFGSLRGDADALRERAMNHARRALEETKESLPEGFSVTATVAEGASVEDAVSRLPWHDGDVIMVGSSRLAAPRRLFLGSTAAKMLRVLDVPMIVVPRTTDEETA